MSYLAEDVDKEDPDIPVWREMEIGSTEQPAKTSFSIPFGLYQFNIMPFGLQGVPAMFQHGPSFTRAPQGHSKHF